VLFLRLLVVGLSQLSSMFRLRADHVGFVVNTVALGYITV